jgi:hypothetical protein
MPSVSSSRLPHEILFDNDISPRISKALNELENREENEVVHLNEKFSADTSDEVWMRSLGQEGDWRSE